VVQIIAIIQSGECDARAILELQKQAYQTEAELYNDFSIPPLTQTLDDIKGQYQTHIFLKAVKNSAIIGSIRAYEKNGTSHIGRLIVHPDHQNKGIGKRLMHEIENCFATTGRFELFTGSKSEKNLHFYQKLGYRIFNYEKLNDAIEFVYLEKIMASKSPI
jgi:ribosomal protein S18 acetylase RimI-like enzyme